MRLDCILPAYNPAQGWELYVVHRLEEIGALRPQWDIHLHVCTDASVRGHDAQVRTTLSQAVGQDKLHYIEYPENRGKGYALREAVRQSEGDCILYTDWDFPFTTQSYLDTLDLLEQGAEVVLPVRKYKQYLGKLSWMRKMLSAGSRMINRLLLALPYPDTQGGIKAFCGRGCDTFLSTNIDRFLFDTEFIALATRRGLDVRVCTCCIREDISLSAMGVNTLKSELKNIPQLIVARWFS